MQTPLQLTFRSIAHSDALATHVQERADKLDAIFDRIISCHVVVEREGHHHRDGDRFRFSINVGLPGHELLVNHGPHHADHGAESAHASADRAFDEAERQLGEWMKRRREHRNEVAS
jgi:ribosomal subunit interface protein